MFLENAKALVMAFIAGAVVGMLSMPYVFSYMSPGAVEEQTRQALVAQSTQLWVPLCAERLAEHPDLEEIRGVRSAVQRRNRVFEVVDTQPTGTMAEANRQVTACLELAGQKSK